MGETTLEGGDDVTPEDTILVNDKIAESVDDTATAVATTISLDEVTTGATDSTTSETVFISTVATKAGSSTPEPVGTITTATASSNLQLNTATIGVVTTSAIGTTVASAATSTPVTSASTAKPSVLTSVVVDSTPPAVSTTVSATTTVARGPAAVTTAASTTPGVGATTSVSTVPSVTVTTSLEATTTSPSAATTTQGISTSTIESSTLTINSGTTNLAPNATSPAEDAMTTPTDATTPSSDSTTLGASTTSVATTGKAASAATTIPVTATIATVAASTSVATTPSPSASGATTVASTSILDNSTPAKAPKNIVSPSPAATQDTSAIRTTLSRLSPTSKITHNRMTVSEENSISVSVSTTTLQYKSNSTVAPYLHAKAIQSLEPFFPTTGKSKLFFVPNPAAYVQNAKNEFSASADESTTVVSNANNFHMEEARPDSIHFVGTTTLMKEGNTANIYAMGILEDYIPLLDVADMKDKNIIIISSYLERYDKTLSNYPKIPQKDDSIVIDATDMKNQGTSTVNAQTPSILSANDGNDFESIPILSKYDNADTKSITIDTDIDETISNINPIYIKNYFLNYRIYKKINNDISNLNDTKTMLDEAKNTMHFEGDLTASKTNGITSTKHYANDIPMEPKTNTNMNFKITWPLKEGMTEGIHPVQMENITTPIDKNIAKTIESNVDNSRIKYHSNMLADVNLQTDRNNFKSVSTDGIENVIIMLQRIENLDQDDGGVKEVIFFHPDTFTTDIRRKGFSFNPDIGYAQTAGNKIILPSGITDMFNPLVKYKIKLFTVDSTNLINRGNPRTPITITANDTKAKTDIERSTVFKTANFQSNIRPVVSITHPGTVGSTYFSENSVADMTSDSKVNITLSDQSTDSVDESIHLSTNNNQAGGAAVPNLETDFPMYKGYTLLSVAESSTPMPNAQNNQAQNSLLIYDDLLTSPWISDPVAENPHLTNDTMTQKWQVNKLSIDPLNIPLEVDFSSPNNAYNVTAHASKGTTNMINSSELMINKATTAEGRPTVAMTSLPAKTAGVLTPRKRFRSLIDKEIANEEESAPDVEVTPIVEEDAGFQIKNLPPAHNSKYFESGDRGFERNGFVSVDTTKSLSPLSSSMPITEVAINDRDFTSPRGENHVLYVIKPENDRMHFQTLATKTIANGLHKSAVVKQNVEAADGTEFLLPSNSIPQIGRMDKPILHNSYYDVISHNTLIITKENPNVVQSIMKHELSLSTLDNADIVDYIDGYQATAAITSSNAKRLANKGKMAGTQTINIPLGISTVSDDISHVNKNTEVITDLASIAATSPTKKGILTMSEVNALNNKPNKLRDDLTISRIDPNMSGDDVILLIADPSTVTKSVAHFNHPQMTNPSKKISLADIIIPKTFHNFTSAALTAAEGSVDTKSYISRYEPENSLREDITLNYEADPPKDIHITVEEENTLKEGNVRDHIYVIPISDDNVPTGNKLADKHYSNSDVYSSIRFKGTTQTTADQLEFENPASTYMTEVSKPPLEEFTSRSQGKVVVANSNSGDDNGEFFGGDILYPLMKENVPKGYTFPPERRSTVIPPNFRIPMKGNIAPAPEGSVLLKKGASRKHFTPYTDVQTDPGTEKEQIAIGSITNAHTGIVPTTFSTTVSSENMNVGNYYQVSGIGTPLSLEYPNTLRGDESIILWHGTTVAKENDLNAMDLIITESDKSDSEYISNKHASELEKGENHLSTKPSEYTRGPNGFVYQTPSSKGEVSKSLLYRIIYPEFDGEDKYQATILKEGNTDFDSLATSFKDYTQNFNTQHLKTIVPSIIEAGKTFPPEFLKRSAAEKGTWPEDNDVIILPQVSGLGNTESKDFFLPHTETTVTMGEKRTFDTLPIDHAAVITSIKGQSHFYRKGISSNVSNTAAPELADTSTSGNSKINEYKMNLAEVKPSEDHSNPLAKGTASQAENISGGEISKSTIKTDSIASINHINVTKMPTNATTISPTVSTFDSKESSENGDSIMPEVDGVLSIKLNSLLIPNWKRSRTAVALSKNDDSFSNKTVTVELSEPLGEHSLIKNPNWKIAKVQSEFHPLSVVSSVPLEDPTAFSETSINVVADILTTENEVLNSKTDSMEKETSASETETNASFSKDKAIVEDEPLISEAKIPVNLREENSANVNPFLLKLDVASAKQKVPGTFKETSPVSTIRTIQLEKARASGSSSLDNDNLERSITTSYSQLHHLPQKPTIPLTAFVADFIKINNSELDPAPISKGSDLKITDESSTSNDIIALTDKKVISPDNIIFAYDNRNIINGKRYLNSAEKDSTTQYEVIPIRKDFSTESDVVFLAEEDYLDNKNLMTMRLDDNDCNYLSEENSFYIGEEKSPTTKIPALIQRLYKYGLHAPSPIHVTESLSNKNSVELKAKKYQLLTSRKGNPDSDKVGSFLKDYTINFKSKLPRTMTHSLTDGNRIFSPESPDDLSLERGIPSENDIIINLPEDKWIEPINTPDAESVEIVEESRAFSDVVSDLTRSTNPIMSKDWLHKRHTVPQTVLYDQRVPSMSLKLKYNQDTAFKAESYHLQDATAPSVSVNPDTELSFVAENSENKKNRVSAYFSPMRTPPTMADTTAISLENSYEGGESTQPNENNIRSKEFPTLQTTESVILMPQVLTEDSALISDGSLTDSSKTVSLVPERVTKYLDLIHGTDISENQVIKIQTDLQPHSFDSIIPSADSVTFTRNSIDGGPDLPSTVERKTVNISKIKTDVQPSDTTMKVLSPTQISSFPSEIRKMATLSVEEDTNAKFDLSHITNATVLIPTLEKTLLSTPEPSTLSKSNSNKEEELIVSKAGNFILGDSRKLRENPFIDRFNISARLQAPPSLKRILSADSTLSHEKTLKPKKKSSALSDEDAGPIGLFHNVPAGSYEQLWKSTLFPFDFTTAMSSSRYSELDPVFKMKKDATTKTNNNTPFQERNSPSNKDIIYPSTNTSTKDMLNIIFTNRSVQRNFVGKDINTENEVALITENISNITSEGENVPDDEDVISTVFDATVSEDVIKKYVLEPQEENNNPVTKEPTVIYDPKIVGSHRLYSNADAYKHLFQGAPTETNTKEMLQNLISREEHFSSGLDNILNSTDNLNYKVPRSMTYLPTHTSENLHKFLGKIPLKGGTLKEDDTSIIFPEDKRMDYTLASNPEITVNMVNRRKFLDGPIDSLVITSPLENKNQFYSKVIPSATYNTDSQGKAENILLPNVKEKTNMAEMPHSWESIFPSADFGVITDGKLSFINEEIKILNSEASISSSPTNTGHTVDEATTLSIENTDDRGDSMSPEGNIRSKEFLTLQIPEKPIFISNASTKNLETFDPVINNPLATSTAWSNMFETMVEYPNSANDGSDPITNETDLKPSSLASTKLPIGSTAFADSSTYNKSDSLPSVNRGTVDISKIKTDEIYSEPHRTIIKAFYPIKVSQNRVYEEGKLANFPDQEDPATKFNADLITNAIVLSPTGEKILSSVTGSNSLPKSDNNIEEEVNISEMGNFLLRDTNTMKENSFPVKFDVTSAKPQAHSSVNGTSLVGSTLTLPEASKSNDLSSSTKVAIEEGTIVNSPTGKDRLSSWKPTPLPSDFTIFHSSSKYYKVAPVVKMKKGIITKTNNNIPSGESNTLSVKANISPTTIISTKGTKNIIDNNTFGEHTFMEKDTAFMEEASFTENISEETHDTFLAGQDILNSNDIVTIIPVDNALEYATNNYILELVKEGNGPLIGKGTHTNDFSVSESYAPSASTAVSEYLTQGYPIDIKTDRKHQNSIPREDIHNSDNDPTALKSSIVHFNAKSPRSMIYSPTDSNWTSSPEFPVETAIEYSSPARDNTIISLPKGKIMEYPFVPSPESMTRMEKDRIITTDSIDPAVISKPVEHKDQFNRRGVSSVLYNIVVPDGAKPSISGRFNANRHNSNLEDMPHSQNTIPLAEFNATPDDDLPFINKNTEYANKASTFSSTLNKASGTVADYIVLSSEDSYEGGDFTSPGEDKVESRRLSSLLTSAMFTPTSLTENPEISGLMTENSLTESLLTRLEMLKRSTEYGDAIHESDVPEGQTVIMQADIDPHPSASNVLLTESPTFSYIPTNGEIDSFFSLDRDTPDNYKTKTDTLYSKSQRTMLKGFSPRGDSQNIVHGRRKITNLFDQEDPAAKSELSHFRNTTVLIPAVGKILPSGIKPNPLSKSNKNREDLFTVKFDATSFRPQTQSNFKKIFLADSTLTLPEASRPAFPDKFTDTGGAITNSPLERDGLRYRSTFPPPYFTTFLENSKYSELVPVTTVGEYTNKKTDYHIPFDETIIPSKEVIIFPNTITSEEEMASTFKENIFEPKDFI
ncbi:hypothetical protein ABFV05_005074 [Capra hircus]